MLKERKIAFDSISRVLAITRYDIEQHQLLNDQSLNIHGENWFRDIFNFVYDLDLINANFESANSSAIDLVGNKLAYQITTTRDRKKVEDTLTGIKKTKYKNYTLRIFFLLEKAKFNSNTTQYFQNKYKLNIKEYLFDYRDLLKDIDALETDKIIDLNKRFFLQATDEYTETIVLNLIFKYLLRDKKDIKIDFNDDFGTVDTNSKLELNGINPRITSGINDGLNYVSVMDSYKDEDSLLSDLKDYIIDNLYKKILLEVLKTKVSKNELLDKKTYELQDIASAYKIDFNKLINKLHQEIENNIEINDWNSMGVAWIIIAFFFELCDVGVDE